LAKSAKDSVTQAFTADRSLPAIANDSHQLGLEVVNFQSSLGHGNYHRTRREDGSDEGTFASGDGCLQWLFAGANEVCDGLNVAGEASAEMQAVARERWITNAKAAGIDLSGFDESASLAERIRWAVSQGIEIATILARYSSKMQHSTRAQVEENVQFAALHRMYTRRTATG
jgi:hypothetical protein